MTLIRKHRSILMAAVVMLALALAMGAATAAPTEYTAGATGATATVDMMLDPNEQWCAPTCAPIEDDYPDAAGEMTYDNCANTLKGSLAVAGMRASFQYQLKIEGMPTCAFGADGDDWSNEQIGLHGRWWSIDGDKNVTEDHYYANPNECIMGYILFDCPSTDGNGEAAWDIDVDYSWHTCGTAEQGDISLPQGSYTANFNVSEAGNPWRTIFLSEDPLQFDIAPCDDCIDSVNIGNELSEAGHDLQGWGPVEPETSGGTWGGFNDTGEDTRVVWESKPEEGDRCASVKLNFGDGYGAKTLLLRNLDGLGDDSFDVSIGDVPVGHYTGLETGTEDWGFFKLSLDPYLSGVHTVELCATGDKWDHWDTYGQVAFDWIAVCEGGCDPRFDMVDIGTPASEIGHNLLGWGPIEPLTNGGVWGSFNLTGEDCRVVWAGSEDPPYSGDDECATVDVNLGYAEGAKSLVLRHLDGLGDDSFDVYINDMLVDQYTGMQTGTEDWHFYNLSLDPTLTGSRTVKLCATGDKWAQWDTYGQVGFDWIMVCGGKDVEPETPPDPYLWVEPADQTIGVSDTTTVDVRINASGMCGVQFDLYFDPALLEVEDADTEKDGTQISVGSMWGDNHSVISNKVTDGKVEFAAILLGEDCPSDFSDDQVAQVTFHGIGHGLSPLNLSDVIVGGTVEQGDIEPVYLDDGTLNVIGSGTIAGTVELQGRDDWSGAEVTVSGGPGGTYQTNVTAADGTWSIAGVQAGTYQVAVEMPVYLDGLKTGVIVNHNATTTLDLVKLLGGDCDDSDKIDIFDAVVVGTDFGSTPPNDSRADINDDGTVNILDAIFIGQNWHEESPVPW